MSRLDCKHDRLARACTECEAEETISDLQANLQAAEKRANTLEGCPLAEQEHIEILQAEVARLKARADA